MNWTYKEGDMGLNALMDSFVATIKSHQTEYSNIILAILISFTVIRLLWYLLECNMSNRGIQMEEVTKILLTFVILGGLIKFCLTSGGLLDIIFDVFVKIGQGISGYSGTLSVENIFVVLFSSFEKVMASIKHGFDLGYYSTHPLEINDIKWVLPNTIFMVVGMAFLTYFAVKIALAYFLAIIEFYLLGSISIVFLVFHTFDLTKNITGKTTEIILANGLRLSFIMIIYHSCIGFLTPYITSFDLSKNWLSMFEFIAILIVWYYILEEMPKMAQTVINTEYNSTFSRGSVGKLAGDFAKEGGKNVGRVAGAVVGAYATGSLQGAKTGYKTGEAVGKYAGGKASQGINYLMRDEGTSGASAEQQMYKRTGENSDDLDRSAGSPEKELMKDTQKLSGNGGGFGSDGGITPPVPPVTG